MSLAESLSGAKIIRADKERGLFLAWFGGHGLHAYDAQGQEVAFWNIGDSATDDASEADVLDDMEEKIQTGKYPWAYDEWWEKYPWTN
ncbi:hypothetical protein TPY_2723 [Sulfobacillus acidophilus TPY]|uniref:Uncharacterized protein n=1 Tax=Sulfobacillus acidophilus (strain ATCC 700253 / DSM 10332 / NAL) TaxID=679936 RepID=G8TUL0_SULAD|nr:hypothetical protein TPY_2723 [Sulfobacillus acidophilus TPY]AEW04657.1 hypothetical protein Sulac_1157 [Sulfobacillus acidophilus DSM 10332]